MRRDPTRLAKLALVLCALIALFAPFFTNAKETQGTCPPVGATLSSNQAGNPSSLTICTTPPGPSTIVLTCNPTSGVSGALYRFFRNGVVVAQSTSNTLTVSINDFSSITLANYNCQVITQSGTCVGSNSNVITVQRCAGGGTCTPVGAVLSSNQGGNPSSLTICTTPPGPSTIVLTCSPTSGVLGALYRFVRNGVVVAQSTSNTLTVSINDFASTTLANYYCQVITQSGTCVGSNSNTITIQRCAGGGPCTPVGAVLSSNQAGNPSSLTICNTPPGPSTIVLTCSPTSGVAGALYRFVRNGVVVAQSTSNTLTVSINDFSSITLANYYCQVITQSGTCVGSNSNVITIQRCAGGGPCTPVGAVLSSNQPGNPSSLTICTTPPGPSTIILTCSPTSGVSGALYRFVRNGVVVAQGSSNTLTVSINDFSSTTLANYYCQIITQSGTCVGSNSNTITIQRCAGGGPCTPVGAVLSSNQPGNPSSLTICTTPPGPSTIILTCSPTSGVSGALYRFVRNGVVVAQSSSNTLTVSINDFSSTTLANYYCQVITQSGTCVGSNSNIITIQRCAGGGGCPTAVTISLIGTCPNVRVRAVVSNPQAGVAYTFTLRRSVNAGGPYVAINSQVVGPFAGVPVAGIVAVFSGFAQTSAFFIVDVAVPGCPVISSNIQAFQGCFISPMSQ